MFGRRPRAPGVSVSSPIEADKDGGGYCPYQGSEARRESRTGKHYTWRHAASTPRTARGVTFQIRGGAVELATR